MLNVDPPTLSANQRNAMGLAVTLDGLTLIATGTASPPLISADTITLLLADKPTGKNYSLRDGVLRKTSAATAKGRAHGVPVHSAGGHPAGRRTEGQAEVSAVKPVTDADVLAALKKAHPRGKFPPLKQWTHHLTRLAKEVTMVREEKPVGESKREAKGRVYLKVLEAHRLALPQEFLPYDQPWAELERQLAALVKQQARDKYRKACRLRDALKEALKAIDMDAAFTGRDCPGTEMLVALLHLAGVRGATVEAIEKMFERERKRVASYHDVTDK